MFWILVGEIQSWVAQILLFKLQTHKLTQSPWSSLDMPCITSSPCGHFSARGVVGRSKRRGRARVLRGVSKWSSGAVCRPGMQDTMRIKHLLYFSCVIYTIYGKSPNTMQDKTHLWRCYSKATQMWQQMPNQLCWGLRVNVPCRVRWQTRPSLCCPDTLPADKNILRHQMASIIINLSFHRTHLDGNHMPPQFHYVPSLTLEHALPPLCSAMSGEESRSLAWRRAGNLLEVMIRMQLWFCLQMGWCG